VEHDEICCAGAAADRPALEPPFDHPARDGSIAQCDPNEPCDVVNVPPIGISRESLGQRLAGLLINGVGHRDEPRLAADRRVDQSRWLSEVERLEHEVLAVPVLAHERLTGAGLELLIAVGHRHGMVLIAGGRGPYFVELTLGSGARGGIERLEPGGRGIMVMLGSEHRRRHEHERSGERERKSHGSSLTVGSWTLSAESPSAVGPARRPSH
jgi:hypothetical protein